MSTGIDDEAEPPGNAEVRELMLSDALPRIARVLADKYPTARNDAEDAVYDAVAKYLAKRADQVEIDKPDSYIFITAQNFMLRKVQRQVNRESGEDDTPEGVGEYADTDAIDKDTYQYLRGIVRRWESKRLREVTLLFLEAAYEGEVLTQQEASEQVSVLLDEDVPWASIGKTRSRGFHRLRDEILDIASKTGINPIDGSETTK